MIELLKGRISDSEGLREVLELVSTFKDVSSGILEIDGDCARGRIGVAWGKFITGAILEDNSRSGRPALRELLQLRCGKFTFVDLENEPPQVDLRQALGIDLLRTICVIPELDPVAADFLWDLGEKVKTSVKPADFELNEHLEPAPPSFAAPLADLQVEAELRTPPPSRQSGDPNKTALDQIFGAEHQTPEQRKPLPPYRPRTLESLPMLQGEPQPEVELLTPPSQQGVPMLQPNVVADPKAVRQRFSNQTAIPTQPTTDSGTLRLWLICLVLFVVSCAGTVLLGPHVWQVLSSLLHQ